MEAGARREGRTILVLLYVGYLLSFADRVIFGQTIKPIKALLRLTDTQVGLLSGLAFAAAYALFSPIGGWIVDRNQRKPIFAAAVAVWSVATIGTAFATTFAAMALTRASVGVGESLLHPIAVSLIGDTVERERRPRAFAFYMSAGAVGTIVALLGGGLLVGHLAGGGGSLLPFVDHVAPWQELFIGAGLLGLVLASAIAFVMREPRRAAPKSDAGEVNSGIAFIRAHPRFAAALFLGISMSQMGAYTLTTWNIPFFERVYGWTGSRAAIALALTGGVATLVGCIAAGRLIIILRQRGHADAPLLLALVAAALFPLFGAIALLMPTPGLMLAVLPLAAFWGYVPSVAAFSAMGEALPVRVRARLAGLHTLANGLIANSLGPFLVGVLSDRAFPQQDGLRWSLIVTLILAGVAGTVLIAQGRAAYRTLVVTA